MGEKRKLWMLAGAATTVLALGGAMAAAGLAAAATPVTYGSKAPVAVSRGMEERGGKTGGVDAPGGANLQQGANLQSGLNVRGGRQDASGLPDGETHPSRSATETGN